METKKCPHCGLELTLDNFCKNKTKEDGLSGFCKMCNKEYAKIRKENNQNVNPYSDPQKMKICSHCKKEKNILDFGKCITKKDGLNIHCRVCCKKFGRNQKYKNKNTYTNLNNIKVCSACKIEKNITFFGRSINRKDGLDVYCKECNKEKRKKWHNENILKNKDINPYLDLNKTKTCWKCQIKKSITNFGIAKRNKDGLNTMCKKCSSISHKGYERSNAGKKKRSNYSKNKRKTNINYRLSRMMATVIWQTLKHKKDKNHWENLVGYTAQDLKNHLEKQFKDGMAWENQGKNGWHIDHIRPVSSFNITDFNCDDFKKCWALSNLQPLWAIDNIKKGNKISAKYNNL
jgi:Tfp pilus tip-associated adhesin PilY1